MKTFKCILYTAVLLLTNFTAHPQLLNVRLGTDALVEDAIKDAVVIVESNYCIQDTETNQKYGRNGKSYFNTLKFLGCKTDKGIVTSETVLEPWTIDNLFDKYRNNVKYKPLLENPFAVRSLPNDTIMTVNIESDISFNNDSTLICIGSDISRKDGLSISSDNKDAINWIVWVKNPYNDESKGSSNLEYVIVKKTLDFSIDNAIVDTPNSDSGFIGGLYVSAKTISVGLVEFSLSGFVMETSGIWSVMPINYETFTSLNLENNKKLNTPDDNNDDNLTPVEENSKVKKKNKTSKKK